ncbi:MAG: hypothetical protein IKG93_01720 [Clostridiales bacterium]|nr:hypothetical protein [Clostridiales bacterium]
MYLKERLIKAFKVKNVILMILAIFQVVAMGWNIIDLLVYYSDDIDTALTAKSMPGSIRGVIVGVLVLFFVALSRKMIGDARFYSSYFEGDLDGYVSVSDLAKVTGKPAFLVNLELALYRVLYMKKFTMKTIEGQRVAELYSKKTMCECKNCGAPIEKRTYFTGQCNYCGSSDLYAKVISGDRFYSVSNELQRGMSRPDYYEATGLAAKASMNVLILIVGIAVLVISAIYMVDMIGKYGDKEYLTKVLLDPDSHLRSFDLIKKDIMHSILLTGIMVVAFSILLVRRIKMLLSIGVAGAVARFFSSCKKPFIEAQEIPEVKASGEKKLKPVRGAIRKGYLAHCTLESHEGALKVALAKKIVKDTCPSCASPINGAVDENYVCKYCGNKIMGVIVKQ